MKSLILAVLAITLIVGSADAGIFGVQARARTRQVRAVQRTQRLNLLLGGNNNGQQGGNCQGGRCTVNRGAANVVVEVAN